MKHFTTTITKNKDERFMVRMPVNDIKLQQLGESKNTVLKRFLSLERKLHKQPSLKDQIHSRIFKLRHMTHIYEQSVNTNPLPRYCIPHHAVLKDVSITTKLRVVFDASCITDIGLSLNDCLIDNWSNTSTGSPSNIIKISHI